MAVGTHTDARRAALHALFDHAALFPPASMAMPDALAEDARVRASGEGWMVGRFVCPLSRLAELGDAPLALSLVLDEEPDGRLDDPRVHAVEIPPGRDADAVAGTGLEMFVERPVDDLDWLEELPRGARAKVRCGGRAVPSVERLAAFVARCRELRLPFKATAGLHHPLRSEHEHGFLNLLAAAVFGDEEAAIGERSTDAFALDREGFSWRGRTAGADEVSRTGRRLLLGIGSCSIREPVDDLRTLGILDA